MWILYREAVMMGVIDIKLPVWYTVELGTGEVVRSESLNHAFRGPYIRATCLTNQPSFI